LADIDAPRKKIYIFHVKNIASVSALQAGVSRLIKRTEADGIVPVSRNGRTVVFMVSRDKMAALLETMELQKNSELMALVKQDRVGKVKYTEVPDEI
jgi:molybdopterin-guanine dinucleotide biosynthesis protein A